MMLWWFKVKMADHAAPPMVLAVGASEDEARAEACQIIAPPEALEDGHVRIGEARGLWTATRPGEPRAVRTFLAEDADHGNLAPGAGLN